MNRIRRCRRRGAPALAAALAVMGCQGPFPQSTFQSASPTGAELSELFVLIFSLAVVVFVLVEGALLYTIIRYRARPGQPDPKPVHGHTTLEIAWTLAPAFIIVLIAVPTVSTIWQEALMDPDDPLRVEVVGHQWWWEFTYRDLGISTANELHLQEGRPVILEMRSADVIHSFWAPGLMGKRDVLAGRTTRLTFTPDTAGTFMGQCAEFCGESHANMRLRVEVDAPEDFDRWVAAQQAPPVSPDSLTPLARRGLEVFMAPKEPARHACVACHVANNASFSLAGPNLTHLAMRSTIAGGVLENTPENLERWLREPTSVKPGMGSLTESNQIIGMPTVALTPDEIEALVAYLGALR